MNKNFEYAIHYNNFCHGYTRDQTQKQLKEDIENSLYKFGSTLYDQNSWLNDQLKSDFPVAKTELVDDYSRKLLGSISFNEA